MLNGRSARATAAVLQVHNTTVYRVLRRFRAYGEAGLFDGRLDSGTEKLDERYLDQLYRIVCGTLQDYGWRRPTWTRELLVETMVRLTGVRIHVATMSRAFGSDQGAAWTPPSNGELPVVENRKNTAFAPHRDHAWQRCLAASKRFTKTRSIFT